MAGNTSLIALWTDVLVLPSASLNTTKARGLRWRGHQSPQEVCGMPASVHLVSVWERPLLQPAQHRGASSFLRMGLLPRFRFREKRKPGRSGHLGLTATHSVRTPGWSTGARVGSALSPPASLCAPPSGAEAAEDRRGECPGVGLRVQLDPGDPLHPLETAPGGRDQSRRRPVSV